MKIVKSICGKDVLFDDKWADLFSLRPIRVNHQNYAAWGFTHNYKNTLEFVHKVIMDVPRHSKLRVDHIDGNPLNNQVSNLRVCTIKENSRNRKGWKNVTSKFTGVSFDKQKKIKQWRATIMVERKQIFLGRYLTEIEAAVAYNDGAKKYFGEFARLNIIED